MSMQAETSTSEPDRSASRLLIRSVETLIVDLPIKRPHQFSATRIVTQAYLLIKVLTEDGIVGIGEGATPGGPWWSGDSIETMKEMIDTYLAPALIGESAARITRLHDRMNRIAFGNNFAKAAIDMALWDILGKSLNVPVHALFGGQVRDKSEISWALATNKADTDVAEAESMLDKRLARIFKLKAGALPPEEDVHRAIAVAKAMNGRAEIRIDLNQAWDEATARRWLPALVDAGVSLIEQPVQGWNIDALGRLRTLFNVRIMADESLTTLQTALRISALAAADVLALKLMKSGGLTACRQISGIAEAAGLATYGGTFLEGSLGTSAGLQLVAAERSLTYGSEYIGGIWLAEEVVTDPLVYKDFHVHVPAGSGLGMNLDEDKVAHFRRKS